MILVAVGYHCSIVDSLVVIPFTFGLKDHCRTTDHHDLPFVNESAKDQ
jgi:hypothetical protein